MKPGKIASVSAEYLLIDAAFLSAFVKRHRRLQRSDATIEVIGIERHGGRE